MGFPPHKSRKYKVLPNYCRVYCVLTSFLAVSVLNPGTIFFCRWFFPDVTTVTQTGGRYEVLTKHSWPFSGNCMPMHSYIANDTEDTLYRVVVSYAFLGEEIKNHYNVTDTITPMTTGMIPCPPNYVARSILPIMTPSHGRLGRTRTRRSYIVTGEALHEFEKGDFRCFGIKDNVRVDSFNITSNPVVWEDPERIKSLEQTIDRIYREYLRR